jgi:hypothetical protein
MSTACAIMPDLKVDAMEGSCKVSAPTSFFEGARLNFLHPVEFV